jgi:hypothetical protein|tara:strand:- start:38 stop:154 length:117 start_codon:yes stop_codon:yes gene_type:complete
MRISQKFTDINLREQNPVFTGSESIVNSDLHIIVKGGV